MDIPTRLSTARSHLASAARRRVAIDTRSLAAFRIAVGLLLVAELLLRARNLGAFYTDAGVLPRSALISRSDPLHLTVHAVSGDAWFQAVLFLIAGAFAVALAIGYRTRFATVGSWLLLVSLHNRNGLVLNGGDVLLRLLLLFAIFLPLAERWSVDARHSEGRPSNRRRSDGPRSGVASVASAALLLQVVLVYATNAAFKLTGEVWLRGDGLKYAFSLGQFTLLPGEILASYPVVLEVLDYAWLGLVAGSFLLVVLTGWARTALVAAFVGAHLGMALTMALGLFPLISIAALLPFLPGSFWDAALPRLASARPARAAGRVLAALDAVLPVVTVSEVPPRLASAARRSGRAASTVLPLAFVVLILLWNVQYLGFEREFGHDPLPDEVEPALELTRTDQYWNMFAPDPLSTDGWIVASGQLEDGSRVDAFHGGDVDWDRPPDVASTYPTVRWRKYLVRLWRYHSANRRYFAEYLCREWNAEHDTRLLNVSVYYVEQPTRIDGGPEPTDRVELADERCSLVS